MEPLSHMRQQLFDIIRTPYTDTLAKVSDILTYVAAQPDEDRAGLMGDTLCWWNMVPMDRDRTRTKHLPFTHRERGETAAALEALIAQRELAPDDAFEQNLQPAAVGALVLHQLAKAQAHSQLIGLVFLFRILSDKYVPYIGHVVIDDPDPATPEQMLEAALAYPDELSMLEAMFQNPHAFSAMPLWMLGLAARTDERTARMLIGYALGRLAVLTRQATQLMMGSDAPMLIRLGDPGTGGLPPDDGDGGIDPKKAN